MGSGVVGVSSSLAVHAGSSLGVSTGVLSLSVEGGVEAVSGSGMSLRGSLSVESSSARACLRWTACFVRLVVWRATCLRV